MKTLKDLKIKKGSYVLVRTSLNVPIEDGQVRNQFRIMRDLPTINILVNAGARVILCGHIGSNGEQSLKPVADVLETHLKLVMSPEVLGSKTLDLRDKLQDGEVLLLENLRLDPREKKNDEEFARGLADLAEVFVMDAFPAAHRSHASVVGVPKYLPTYAGINFMHEYDELTKALKPKTPSLFMLGGAKFDTKMPLVEKFLDLYDHIFIGGALANDFFKAKGYEIGKSLVSDVSLVDSPLLSHPKILVPVDVVVDGPDGRHIALPDNVSKEETIFDVGPATVEMLKPLIQNAKMVLWNGPFGDYERGFEAQTVATAKLVANTKGYSVLGGGDTIAAIESLCNQECYGFLSTAGGAMLTFLEHGTLPAIEAMESES
ncbi:phosphoglycerate kinase [Candidatus Kaiserbacteria bacterium]|nr:phosphoglycerate kinase [Candidatus Kaiserbacteria bacterium]